ncbi:hypothetical protein ACRQ5Q_13710 [Bradyrhizobium sp. PMVTL-01]|uniref:hypothetical protein n=1 Tax=Bradyrhizobium sp. PMVTL-01 TaxID=3434999 RepID=UPI003F72A68C
MFNKKAIPKKRSGRLATGKDPSRTFRLSDEFMANLDGWAAQQPDKPSRSEAIRRLVEIGLSKPQRPQGAGSGPEKALRAMDDTEDLQKIGPKGKK